jgi:trans-2,3-dihydro-3-hydroxyanthranilate isomerase
MLTDSRVRSAVIVRACLRDGRGGSPTAVLDETELDEGQRREVPGCISVT